MNKPLQLIYDRISYKMWFVQFFNVDRDIKFTIKTLLQHYSLKRTIQPPTPDQIRQHDMWTDYIDDQGIVFVFYGLHHLPEKAYVQTSISYDDANIISLQYIYSKDYVYLGKAIVNFNTSDCNPSYIKSHQPLNTTRYQSFDTPLLFYTY